MNVIELTLTTPQVQMAAATLREDGIEVGVGAVTTAEEAATVVESGASFVVSHCAPDGMVDAAHDLGAAAIPGALTPSEVEACRQSQPDAVRLFPARQCSPRYLRELVSIMPEMPIMVTGGLRLDPATLRPWLDAGVLAVGLGGALGTVATIGADAVERHAHMAVGLAALIAERSSQTCAAVGYQPG